MGPSSEEMQTNLSFPWLPVLSTETPEDPGAPSALVSFLQTFWAPPQSLTVTGRSHPQVFAPPALIFLPAPLGQADSHSPCGLGLTFSTLAIFI